MPKLGPYSRNATLAKLDQRTKEARLANSLRKDPAETYRDMVRAWNRAVTTIPGWPGAA